jgi:hypothetical protein
VPVPSTPTRSRTPCPLIHCSRARYPAGAPLTQAPMRSRRSAARVHPTPPVGPTDRPKDSNQHVRLTESQTRRKTPHPSSLAYEALLGYEGASYGTDKIAHAVVAQDGADRGYWRVSSRRPLDELEGGRGAPTRAQQSNTDQQISFRNHWSSSTSSRIGSGSWSRCHRHSRRPAASPSPAGAAARAALIA